LDRLILGSEVDAANGEGSDRLMLSIMLPEENEASLSNIQRAAGGQAQRHLILTAIELLILHCNLDAAYEQFVLAETLTDIMRQFIENQPHLIGRI